MLEKLKAVEDRYNEMAERAAQPDFYADPQAAAKLLREQRQLEPLMNVYRSYCKTRQEALDLREMLDGQLEEEMRQLCQEELPEYVQPVGYMFVDTPPYTPVGKVDYRALEQSVQPSDY